MQTIKSIFLGIIGIIGAICAFLFFRNKGLDKDQEEMNRKIREKEALISKTSADIIAEVEKQQKIVAEGETKKDTTKDMSGEDLAKDFNDRYK